MKFFKPWTWFQSEERELKKEQLRLEIENLKLQYRLLCREVDSKTGENPATIVVTDRDEPRGGGGSFDLGAIIEQPYKSLQLLDGDTVVVVMKDGDVFTKENVDFNFYKSIKGCTSEQELLFYFIPAPVVDETATVQIETEEERRMVLQNDQLLTLNPEFVKKGGLWYLVGVELPLPASVSGTFVEILEKKLLSKDDTATFNEAYEALKMFWYWTALNPIESSRNDLLSFVKQHDINITKNGLLEMYRRIVKVNKVDTGKVEAISANYNQIKKWKKSPANFSLVKTDKGEYLAVKHDKVGLTDEIVGNLAELYCGLADMEDNRFTDNHTRSKDIRIGQVYMEDEDKIDLNNRRDCSNGLHVGSSSFGFGGFGDTGVLALVNPCKVRSVPVGYTNKMRVSEMFIAAEMKVEDYKDATLRGEINDYSQEYFNASVDELAKAVKDKTFEAVYACQGEKTPLSVVSVENVKNILAQKVVEI